MAKPQEILTVGHSTHSIEDFLDLLRGAGVEAIADVRRHPGSRRHPQFNAAALAASLEDTGIRYERFGEELGGRRAEAGRTGIGEAFAAYGEHMRTPEFAAGIERLERFAASRRVALMCAEGEPDRCHRWLIADALSERGRPVSHVLPDGTIEPHRPKLRPTPS